MTEPKLEQWMVTFLETINGFHRGVPVSQPGRLWDPDDLLKITAAIEAALERQERDAKAVADGYKEAPCFSALLGESDPDNPCTCPTCALRLIAAFLASEEE